MRNWFKKWDSDSIWKWGLLIGAGILGFFANIFDTRAKDKKYEARMNAEVEKKTRELLEDKAA